MKKSKVKNLKLSNAKTPARRLVRHSRSGDAGNAVTPSRVSPLISAERVQAYIRSRFNPIRSLTPELLSQYLDSFKTGHLRQCALIWDAIDERDYILSTVIPKRKAAAARHGWEILTLDSIAESQKKEAELHKQALENFYNNLTVTNAIDENERGEVSLLLRQMMDAVGKRYAVHEIVWQPGSQRSEISGQRSDGNILTAELRFVPLWFFENTKGKLRYLQSEGALEGVEMEDDSWLVSVGEGLMPACSVAYMYKTMSFKDWVIYNERHGMPGIHGKTDAAKDSDEWDALVTAVQNFAADWALVTNSGATIDKIDMATQGQLPYPPLVERMDRAMSALWRGADLSTLSAGQGQGQGASLQGDESKTLEEDDAKWLSETLSRNLDRRVIEYTFGAGIQPLAYIKIKTAQKKDIQTEILIDKFLIEAGAPVGIKNTLEKYNRPVPDPTDELLTQPAPAISLGQSPGGDAGIRPGAKMGLSNTAPIPTGSLLNQRIRDQNLRDQSDLGPLTSAPLPAKPDSPAVGRLMAEARMQLAEAQEQVLQPLRAALEEIIQSPDSDLQSQIANLKSKIPELLRQVNADPATAKVLEDVLSESLLQGLTINES